MKMQISNARLLQENGVSALSFSPKNDFCAVATKKNHTVHVFKVKTLNDINTWTLLQDFKDHTQTVSDVDWTSDLKILTSSHDRSVFVWKQGKDNKWERMLVNIDIKLSILVSKWAPSGKKFAMGSTCNTLALGFFNVGSNCWTVQSRNHAAKNAITTSPISALCFHPSSNILAVGTVSCVVRIVTVSLKKSKNQLTVKSNVEDHQYKGPFQAVDSLFEVLFTIENIGGWVNHLSFQNNGSVLLVVPHHNHIKLLEIADNSQVVVNEEDIRWNGLPFMSGYINSNKQLILAGFDKKVARFIKKSILNKDIDNYTFGSYLEQNQKSGKTAKTSLVANLTKGIEKRESLFANQSTESQHVNTTKVIQVGGKPVSYDLNGVIHFWTEA